MHWLDYIKRPFEWLASSLRHVQSERPLSPAPELSQFETEDDFLRERSRWFREHGDGSELPDATRREQNTVFQRLKDRLFALWPAPCSSKSIGNTACDACDARGSECIVHIEGA